MYKDTKNSDRAILHCDANSFFASVEMALNPALKSVPMAVCGNEAERHGIVLAKNELAKKIGIVTAETVHSARRKCKELVICEPHHALYFEYSKKLNAIYSDYTDLIEPFGIDESWLDVTKSSYLGTPLEIAEKIRLRVKRELGITVSIGVSFNKVFAKLGSDYKKPDAITVISRDNFKSLVYPLAVESLLFVGNKTRESLNSIGIRTVGDLAHASDSLIESRLGKSGIMLLSFARGEDSSPVSTESEELKSVSNGYTFTHDITSIDDFLAAIDYLSIDIGKRLRSHRLMCQGVSLVLKDCNLRTYQRQRPLASPTNDSRAVAELAAKILEDENRTYPVRAITVCAINLVSEDFATDQLDFFSEGKEEASDRAERREVALDEIRRKFGKDSILNASIISTDFGIYKKDKK